MKPPSQLDGADVLEWAWSDEPFGEVPVPGTGEAIPIHGLAICRYPGSDSVYRFSCDRHWETQQDMDYASGDEAKAELPAQYRRVSARWERMGWAVHE